MALPTLCPHWGRWRPAQAVVSEQDLACKLTRVQEPAIPVTSSCLQQGSSFFGVLIFFSHCSFTEQCTCLPSFPLGDDLLSTWMKVSCRLWSPPTVRCIQGRCDLVVIEGEPNKKGRLAVWWIFPDYQVLTSQSRENCLLSDRTSYYALMEMLEGWKMRTASPEATRKTFRFFICRGQAAGRKSSWACAFCISAS